MITTIIFDAFGTLIKGGQDSSANKIYNDIVTYNKNVDYNGFMDEWKRYYKSHTSLDCEFMTERDIFISRIKMFYERFGVRRNAEEEADALLKRAFERETFEEVKSVVDELRKHYKIFIGSNTDNYVLEAIMNNNNIVVDKVYTSEDLKSYKPNTIFFKRILDENGLSVKNVLFVGDSVCDDILGPRKLGIKTVLVDRTERTSAVGQDYTVNNLRQLYDILQI